MSQASSSSATFSGLVDLAAAGLGGRIVGTTDEFFAGAENLLLPGRALFIEGKFTERGKWMDGWESRRRRGGVERVDGAGLRPAESVAGGAEPFQGSADCDSCVIALGAPGEIAGFDIDTQHFVGNHPPFASVDGLWAPGVADPLAQPGWASLLDQAPLRPDAQNLFAALPRGPVTHVRLNIFPDGGVARFRAFGRVSPRWEAPQDLDDEARAHVTSDLRDLAAVANGGVALACSDAFFGPMNNLLLPGRPADMGGGWETRRRRGPGHDWILIRMGGRGVPAVVEIDTRHFKGNFPDRASVDAIEAPAGARITDLIASGGWGGLLPESRLRADARHFFPVTSGAAVTHVRLNIFPDGGVARLRVWGRRT